MIRFTLLGLAAHLGLAAARNNLPYVDQLIGTTNGGNVFAGASLPFGMAKAVADTTNPSDQGGFVDLAKGNNVTGFSSLHDSGTGGSPSLGNFELFAYASCENDTIDGCTYPKTQRNVRFDPSTVKAAPGYFGLTLESGVAVDMTVTEHTSLYRFQFPPGSSGSPLVLMDLTDLSNSRQDNASISVDPSTGRMMGSGRFLPSFGEGNYVAYFCADFSGPSIRDTGIFVNSRASDQVQELTISRGINGYPLPGGGFVRFNSQDPVLARVGLSFISTEQACSVAEQEIPNFNFKSVMTAATNVWREKMSPITVDTKGVNPALVKNFYSGIYRTMINPQNYTGFVPTVSSDKMWFDSFYCLWDLFRSQIPFLTIVDTPAVIDMINGLLNIYEVDGWLPDCHMSLNKGYTQGGSNADNILSDVYQKTKTNEIDWNLAYEAVVKDAEVEPYGRGGIDSWKRLGYVPVQDFDYKGFGTMTRSISRTLEYSYNDFCISRMAAGLGHTADVQKYQQSSENWENLFKADQTSDLFNGTNTGFTGFFQPRFLNQTWGFQDPLWCSNIDPDNSRICSLQNDAQETFESSIWEYSFFVPGSQGALIKKFGGPQNFVKRLSYMHDNKITYIGNEPAFLTVFQYHYAGRPALSAERSHFYIPKYFKTTHGGLPGNDDSGAMGSFVAMSMIGMFPNPGQNVFLITPPYFESVTVKSGLTGKTATIRNVNFDPSYKNIYIQKATLNGKPYTKNWIDFSFFTEGKELVLTLGPKESNWGTAIKDLPPSLTPYDS